MMMMMMMMMRSPESIYVACVGKGLVTIPLSALLATNGFIKGVVVSQVDWGYVADFKCKRCLDGDSDPVGLLSEVELEPGVKVECVSKFCYLGGHTRFWWRCCGSG